MVFFGLAYWREELPAANLLHALFRNANREKDYKDNVLITDDENEAVAFIVRKAPPDNAHLERLLSLGIIA
jgi:hypothetical protein